MIDVYKHGFPICFFRLLSKIYIVNVITFSIYIYIENLKVIFIFYRQLLKTLIFPISELGQRYKISQTVVHILLKCACFLKWQNPSGLCDFHECVCLKFIGKHN